MDEDVITAVFRLDEPVALLGIEPLDRALGHAISFLCSSSPGRIARVFSTLSRPPQQRAASGHETPRPYLPRISQRSKRHVITALFMGDAAMSRRAQTSADWNHDPGLHWSASMHTIMLHGSVIAMRGGPAHVRISPAHVWFPG